MVNGKVKYIDPYGGGRVGMFAITGVLTNKKEGKRYFFVCLLFLVFFQKLRVLLLKSWTSLVTYGSFIHKRRAFAKFSWLEEKVFIFTNWIRIGEKKRTKTENSVPKKINLLWRLLWAWHSKMGLSIGIQRYLACIRYCRVEFYAIIKSTVRCWKPQNFTKLIFVDNVTVFFLLKNCETEIHLIKNHEKQENSLKKCEICSYQTNFRQISAVF